MTTVTLSELAQRLGVSTSTLRRALMEGRLQGRKSAGTWLFDDDQQAAAEQIKARPRKGKDDGQHNK